jgi:hypothetical protein
MSKDPQRAWYALGVLVLETNACMQKPCQCAAVAASPPPVSTQATCAPKPAAPFAAPPLLVWDGEGTGSAAQGWAACQQGTDCETNLAVKPGAGHDGSTGLQFDARGPEWMGFGWNWFAWYPSSAGSDISKYKSLELWIKISGDPGKRPEPFTVKVSLTGSSRGGKDETESVPINDYAPGFADGAWHQVSIPLDPMLRGKGDAFDTSKAWALTIGAWNQDVRKYTIQIDDIRFL